MTELNIKAKHVNVFIRIKINNAFQDNILSYHIKFKCIEKQIIATNNWS